MKKFFLSMVAMMVATVSFAQIGYQVSLLDNATGEPRANETVSCTVTLSNSEGVTIYTGTQSATSNEFGVLSLTVGNSAMFKDMDWSKLPLYVSVSVDGKLIGKSQVLNVPVAEYAKKTGTLTYDNIGSKTIVSRGILTNKHKFSFSGRTVYYDDETTGTYYIEGNMVFIILKRPYFPDSTEYFTYYTYFGMYCEENDTIYIVED